MVINRTSTSGVSSNDFWGYVLFHDPQWQFRKFDFDRDLALADEKLGAITDATDPNLEEFRRLGHRLIYYHGAADPLIPAQNGIDYYESVVAAQKGLERTQGFFRAFFVPVCITAQEDPVQRRSAVRCLRLRRNWMPTMTWSSQ